MSENINFMSNPSSPSSPQLGGDEGKSLENTDFIGVSENSVDLPHSEGIEGSEGSVPKEQKEEVTEYRETFSDKINLNDLPPLLQDIAATQSDPEDMDSILLATLTILSGAMPSCYGLYDKRKVYPPFYLIIFAPPASDKGTLKACRQLLMPIEKEIEKEYNRELEDYQKEMIKF